MGKGAAKRYACGGTDPTIALACLMEAKNSAELLSGCAARSTSPHADGTLRAILTK